MSGSHNGTRGGARSGCERHAPDRNDDKSGSTIKSRTTCTSSTRRPLTTTRRSSGPIWVMRWAPAPWRISKLSAREAERRRPKSEGRARDHNIGPRRVKERRRHRFSSQPELCEADSGHMFGRPPPTPRTSGPRLEPPARPSTQAPELGPRTHIKQGEAG